MRISAWRRRASGQLSDMCQAVMSAVLLATARYLLPGTAARPRDILYHGPAASGRVELVFSRESGRWQPLSERECVLECCPGKYMSFFYIQFRVSWIPSQRVCLEYQSILNQTCLVVVKNMVCRLRWSGPPGSLSGGWGAVSGSPRPVVAGRVWVHVQCHPAWSFEGRWG